MSEESAEYRYQDLLGQTNGFGVPGDWEAERVVMDTLKLHASEDGSIVLIQVPMFVAARRMGRWTRVSLANGEFEAVSETPEEIHKELAIRDYVKGQAIMRL